MEEKGLDISYTALYIVFAMSKKKQSIVAKQMNWKPTQEDFRIIRELQARLGVSPSDIMRLGIRALVQKEGATA